MWREHHQWQQVEQVQQQVWSRPAPIAVLTADAAWISLPTPLKTAVEANWALNSCCARTLDA